MPTSSSWRFLNPINMNGKLFEYYLGKAEAWIRLFVFRSCPQCDSTSPEVKHCKICNGKPIEKVSFVKRYTWAKWKRANSKP